MPALELQRICRVTFLWRDILKTQWILIRIPQTWPMQFQTVNWIFLFIRWILPEHSSGYMPWAAKGMMWLILWLLIMPEVFILPVIFPIQLTLILDLQPTIWYLLATK